MGTARCEELSARDQIPATRSRYSRMRGDPKGRPWEHPESLALRRRRRKARVLRSTLAADKVVEAARIESDEGEDILGVPIISADQKSLRSWTEGACTVLSCPLSSTWYKVAHTLVSCSATSLSSQNGRQAANGAKVERNREFSMKSPDAQQRCCRNYDRNCSASPRALDTNHSKSGNEGEIPRCRQGGRQAWTQFEEGIIMSLQAVAFCSANLVCCLGGPPDSRLRNRVKPYPAKTKPILASLLFVLCTRIGNPGCDRRNIRLIALSFARSSVRLSSV